MFGGEVFDTREMVLVAWPGDDREIDAAAEHVQRRAGHRPGRFPGRDDGQLRAERILLEFECRSSEDVRIGRFDGRTQDAVSVDTKRG